MTQDEFSCLYEENSFTCIIKKGLAMLDGDRIRIEHIDSDMEVLTIPDELPVTLYTGKKLHAHPSSFRAWEKGVL